MRKLILILVAFFVFINSYGQEPNVINHQNFIDKTIKTPGFFSFNNYSKKGSVDLSTGKFGLTIPFYTFSNKYIELPVGISYSTSGVKVSEEFVSNMPIDWSLYGVGKITRIQKGMPDDLKTSYSPAEPGFPSNFGKNCFTGKVTRDRHYNNLKWFYTSLGGGGYNIQGAATTARSEVFLTQFPNVMAYNGNKLAPAKNEIESIYENYRLGIETQRDIFHVHVGKLDFYFMLKNKKDDTWKNLNPTQLVNEFVKAVSINKPGVKIDFKVESIPYWNVWIKTLPGSNDESYTRRERNQKHSVITGFTITDTDGVKYVFNEHNFYEKEYLKEYYHGRKEQIYNNKRWMQYSLEDVIINEWYLSKIIFPNKDELAYKYEEDYVSYPFVVPRKHDGEYRNKTYNNSPLLFNGSINVLHNRIYKKVIKEILLPRQGKIKFSFSSDKDTSLPIVLDNVTLNDVHNHEIKKLTLKKEQVNYDDPLFNHSQKRVFLKEIVDSEKKQSYKFSYKNKEDIGNSCNIYEQDIYGYYLGDKPNSLKPAYPRFYILPDDYTGNKMLYDAPVNFEKEDKYYTFAGEDRSVNASKVLNGVMDRVEFPTGGKLEIKYEPNTYKNRFSSNKQALGPGVRVLSLQYYDDLVSATPSLTKKYDYNKFDDQEESSGIRLFRPSFAYVKGLALDNDKNWGETENRDYIMNLTEAKSSILDAYKHRFYSISNPELIRRNFSIPNIYKKMTQTSTHSMGTTSDIFGREIIYKNVTESYVNNDNKPNGYKKYTFHYGDNRPEVNIVSGPTKDYVHIQPAAYNFTKVLGEYDVRPWYIPNNGKALMVDYGYVEKRGKEIYPFPDREYFNKKDGLLNGKLIKEEVFDTSKKQLSSTRFFYDKELNNAENGTHKKLSNLSIHYVPTHLYKQGDNSRKKLEQIPYKRVYRYSGLHYFYQDHILLNSPLKQVKKEFKNYSNGRTLKESTAYEYTSKGHVQNKYSLNSSGEKYRTIYTYPYLVYHTNSEADKKLLADNRLTTLMRVSDYVDGKFLKSEKINHKVLQSREVVPHKIQILKGQNTKDNSLEDRVIYHAYDDKGNPLEISKKDGTHIVYVWGYNKTTLIAKVESATYAEVKPYIGNLQVLSDKDKDAASENALRTALNTLRSKLSNAQVTTYTHDPLIGITSITDAKGDVVYYQYDNFNRLQFVKDKDGNMLKEHQYNYKN